VKQRGEQMGYDSNTLVFGHFSHQGCNMRDEILERAIKYLGETTKK
jgi:hypothetical protein